MKHLLPAAFAILLVAGMPAAGQTVRPAPTRAQPDAANSVDGLLRGMTLDRKIGQLLLVQFTGPVYSGDIAAMVRTYHVGGVIFYARNGNIRDADQLRGVIAQMQRASALPLFVAIDQEGGHVDRLAQLMWLDKRATWDLAADLGGGALVEAILEHTHSCYLGDRSLRHDWGYGCGNCPACELRERGYRQFAASA